VDSRKSYIFASTMETVVLKNLSIGYATKGNSKVVAQGLNAAINSGELTCLLGCNGIGKSTLLRTLSAFQPALGGDVMLSTSQTSDIRPLASFTDKELSRIIGIVLTEKPDVRNMTTEDLVGMGRSPYTGFWGTLTAEDSQIVEDAISMVGIDTLRGRMIHTLSDGERQKVMIAKALAQQTPIIYLDEPTAFLDYPSKVEMMQLLRRLAHEQQKTIFLSTHDVELALQLADCLWLMECVPHSDLQVREPNQLSVGTPRQLADNGALSRFIERDGIIFERDTLTLRIFKR
jgi:iron complex transport system ATP-binding protein